MTTEQENAAYYSVTPAPVRYDPELSPNAKLLYGEITSLCNKRGYCWATNSYFTQLFNLSASTISRLISQLERRGHIVIKTVATETGSERRIFTDVYRVELLSVATPEGGTQKQQAPQGGAQKPQRGDSQKSQGGVRKNRKQNDYQLNDYKENDPPYSPPEGDAPPERSEPVGKLKPKTTRREKSAPSHNPEAFEIFWAGYPRKDDRKAAIRAWDKLKPDRELCRIMYDALKRQRGSEQWAEKNGKFIPMFSSWLNGRKWENQGVDLSLISQPRETSGGAMVYDPEVTR